MDNNRRKVKHFKDVGRKFNFADKDFDRVEFFFYANTEDAAANLSIDLSQLGYEIYKTDYKRNPICVSGCTLLIPTDEDSFVQWVTGMEAIAQQHNAEFDGWGMLAELDGEQGK
jgi:Regulator of ribonuclease activity B